MDKIINVRIRNRIATVASGDFIICGNEDYSVVFDFDDEWNGISTKTARFYHNGRYEDYVFSGNTVAAPEFANLTHVEVGVFADEITTTPARIPCLKSILCRGGLVYEPPDDVYAQIIKLINESGLVGPTGTSVSDAVVNETGHLIMILSDGREINCGLVNGGGGSGNTGVGIDKITIMEV